jgi:hypothetical protein
MRVKAIVSLLTISAGHQEENPPRQAGGRMTNDPRLLLLLGLMVLLLAFIRDRKRGAFDPEDTVPVGRLPIDVTMNRRAGT